QIADGTAQLIIGTQALFTEDVTFANLGLVVADEQHRFGVAQRSALSQKGDAPHLLVMSATPIPRTLALIAYGELDISVIGELPPGRQTIDTFLVGEDMRKRINAFIRKQCELGGQVYIVCPAVEESELESLKSAQMWAQTLQSAVFPDLRVGLLHGKMKGAEKDAVMSAFSRHEIDILVSTTVIEVGVDVPNATLMVVENADRFGLSQLHQLRGRVGRGSRKSYCVLFSSNRNPDTLARLKALCETNDGFAIAQKDLQMRGPGDFFGSRQHGLPVFRSANLELDMHTLEQAQQAAADSLTGDWESDDAFRQLKARVDVLFETMPPRLN
ncbi:MAG: ATP-dependent DNA helicase RecG, partial [Oscillospiraceae bacterium]|nr:ATP-dependent DNA helicase RecG [Oscillospiraceae bacterium]